MTFDNFIQDKIYAAGNQTGTRIRISVTDGRYSCALGDSEISSLDWNIFQLMRSIKNSHQKYPSTLYPDIQAKFPEVLV